MSMAQAWSLIGLLATAFGALIVATHRSMSINSRQLSDTLNYGFTGLRNEMVARFEKVDQGFEHVDQRFEQVDQRSSGWRIGSTRSSLGWTGSKAPRESSTTTSERSIARCWATSHHRPRKRPAVLPRLR